MAEEHPHKSIRAEQMQSTIIAEGLSVDDTFTAAKLYWMQQFIDTVRTVQPLRPLLVTASFAYDAAFNHGTESMKGERNE